MSKMTAQEQRDWVQKFQDRAFEKYADDPEKLRAAIARLNGISPKSLPALDEMIQLFG
jgi:hypothetical protein